MKIKELQRRRRQPPLPTTRTEGTPPPSSLRRSFAKASSRKSFKKGASKALRAEGEAVVFQVVAGEPPQDLPASNHNTRTKTPNHHRSRLRQPEAASSTTRSQRHPQHLHSKVGRNLTEAKTRTANKSSSNLPPPPPRRASQEHHDSSNRQIREPQKPGSHRHRHT